MKPRETTYLLAWAAYVAFSLTLFPQLNIPIMLVSIPLTMLGGWLYRYPGAIATVLLTVPYHYFMLSFHSDDPALIREAFNPFGIGLQLCFSCSTALLKTTRQRLEKLNASLEQLVEERTCELRKLADYLVEADRLEQQGVIANLLANPQKHLKAMAGLSRLLLKHLETTRHPKAGQAEEIAMVVDMCLANLRTMENGSITISATSCGAEQAIRQMATQIGQLSDVDCTVSEGGWGQIDPDKHHHLCHIVHEAVTNALRHASPSRIDIGITDSAGNLIVYIENDGARMPEVPKEGMGLPLMRYRAAKIGATLSICTGGDRTVRVECILPPKAAG